MDIVDRDLNNHLARIEADENYFEGFCAFEEEILSSLPKELAYCIAEQLAENELYIEIMKGLIENEREKF